MIAVGGDRGAILPPRRRQNARRQLLERVFWRGAAAGQAGGRAGRVLLLRRLAPILVVFLFSQRALVSGMLAGATKE
jgi:hypothetical protein